MLMPTLLCEREVADTRLVIDSRERRSHLLAGLSSSDSFSLSFSLSRPWSVQISPSDPPCVLATT